MLLFFLSGCLGPSAPVNATAPTVGPEVNAAVQDLTNLLNLQLQMAGQNATVQFQKVEPITLYKVTYRFNGQEVYFLVNDKGEALPYNPVNLKQVLDQLKNQQQMSQPQKSDKPTVILFIMSRCPFGDKAEQDFEKILARNMSMNFKVVYMIDSQGPAQTCLELNNQTFCSMHGRDEVIQDAYEKAVFNLYGANTWAQFAGALDKCGHHCLNQTLESMGIKEEVEQYVHQHLYEILLNDTMESMAAQMAWQQRGNNRQFGSPTVFINGAFKEGYIGGPAYLDLVCSAYNNPPAVCNTGIDFSNDNQSGGAC